MPPAQRVDGDSLIKKGSLSGNRLRDRTLTGLQIKVSSLGTVPTAKNAEELGGRPPSAYLGGGGGGSQIGTNGVVKTAGSANGTKVTLFTSGPFTVTMTCTDDGTETSSEIDASSSEDQSDLNGEFAEREHPDRYRGRRLPDAGRHRRVVVCAANDRAGGAERGAGDRQRHRRRGQLRHRVLG